MGQHTSPGPVPPGAVQVWDEVQLPEQFSGLPHPSVVDAWQEFPQPCGMQLTTLTCTPTTGLG